MILKQSKTTGPNDTRNETDSVPKDLLQRQDYWNSNTNPKYVYYIGILFYHSKWYNQVFKSIIGFNR